MALPSYEAWTEVLKHANKQNSGLFMRQAIFTIGALDAAIKINNTFGAKAACEAFLLKNKPGSSDYTKYGELVGYVLDMIEGGIGRVLLHEGLAKKESSLPPDVTLKRFKRAKTPEEIAKRDTPAKEWALSSESELEQYKQPANYTSVIPFAVYLALQNKWRQEDNESEFQWAIRIRQACFHPDSNEYVQSLMPFAGIDFKAQLEAKSDAQAAAQKADKEWVHPAMKRDELMDGMSRIGRRRIFDSAATAAAKAKDSKAWDVYSEFDSNLRIREFDPTAEGNYHKTNGRWEKIEAGRTQTERENTVVEALAKATNVDTPKNGSVFWNGVDCCKLAVRVGEWNKSKPGLFGQLEATTDVRLVNQQYVYGGKVQEYFEQTSKNYGLGASGVMTAVVMWGFRDSSILTFAELPAILYAMADKLVKGEKPAVTSVSIVLIDPLIDPLINPSTSRVKIVNNIDILSCPVWQPAENTKGYAKSECKIIQKDVTLGTNETLETFLNTCGDASQKNRCSIPTIKSHPGGQLLRNYLIAAGNTNSPAAKEIEKDVEKIVYKNYTFST